jgi:hypothetical protein
MRQLRRLSELGVNVDTEAAIKTNYTRKKLRKLKRLNAWYAIREGCSGSDCADFEGCDKASRCVVVETDRCLRIVTVLHG